MCLKSDQIGFSYLIFIFSQQHRKPGHGDADREVYSYRGWTTEASCFTWLPAANSSSWSRQHRCQSSVKCVKEKQTCTGASVPQNDHFIPSNGTVFFRDI